MTVDIIANIYIYDAKYDYIFIAIYEQYKKNIYIYKYIYIKTTKITLTAINKQITINI